MAQTVIRGAQILNNTVQRQDLDTSTVGQAVVTKVIQGSGITLSSTGADSGTGDVTVTAAPGRVSSDANNLAVLGSDNLISVPASSIWSVRLRSFNSIGNPTFEIDQRTVGTGTNVNSTFALDRWKFFRNGTLAATAVQTAASPPIVVPGTTSAITRSFLRTTLNTQEASLGAGDYLFLLQFIEGTQLRELISGVHSLSILARSSVANLIFSANLRDSSEAFTLGNLCSLGAANTWSLIQLPNLAQWTASGTFPLTPGVTGYELIIGLAVGSTALAPSAGSWLSGSYYGVTGMSNFAASAANSTFDLAFVQHEPGALCTTPIDSPYSDNLFQTLRYFQKSYDTANPLGNTGAPGRVTGTINATFLNFLLSEATYNALLAKAPPTVTIYSDQTGAVNAARNVSTGADATVNSTIASQKSINQIGFASNQVAGNLITFQYAVDTGW